MALPFLFRFDIPPAQLNQNLFNRAETFFYFTGELFFIGYSLFDIRYSIFCG